MDNPCWTNGGTDVARVIVIVIVIVTVGVGVALWVQQLEDRLECTDTKQNIRFTEQS
jgi:hypothetical protein